MSTPASWKLDSYTVDTLTDLVAETANVTTIIASNTDLLNDAVVQVEYNGANISGSKIIPAGESESLRIKSLPTTAAVKIQVSADITGVEFTAVGLTP
ncbi:MAG: hypothetical protein VYD45_11155 [Pseudomonadota bacterium]|nr:hypothetical protein [Pseudomonadota bacterium]